MHGLRSRVLRACGQMHICSLPVCMEKACLHRQERHVSLTLCKQIYASEAWMRRLTMMSSLSRWMHPDSAAPKGARPMPVACAKGLHR